jgi:hypothetical protein
MLSNVKAGGAYSYHCDLESFSLNVASADFCLGTFVPGNSVR